MPERHQEEAMTNERIDQILDTQDHEAPTDGEPELVSDVNQAPSDTASSHARRGSLMRPLTALAKPVSGMVAIARSSVAAAGRGATTVVTRLPTTIRATQAGATEATGALQGLPDPTLRSLAATSVGIGAGLYLARAPRAVVVIGMVPAMLMGAAIATRPDETPAPGKTQDSDPADG
jgi:hypothetical protein